MKELGIDFLILRIKSNSGEIVLLGAGILDILTQYALAERGLLARCFCDNEEAKQGKEYCGLDTISSAELIELGPEIHV